MTAFVASGIAAFGLNPVEKVQDRREVSAFEKNPFRAKKTFDLPLVIFGFISCAIRNSDELLQLGMNSNLFTKAAAPARVIAHAKFGGQPKIRQCLNKGAKLHTAAFRTSPREKCTRVKRNIIPSTKRVSWVSLLVFRSVQAGIMSLVLT